MRVSNMFELWLATRRERRYTIPKDIQEKIVHHEIEEMKGIDEQSRTDREVLAFAEKYRLTLGPPLKPPDPQRVLAKVKRHAPPMTLRRKAKERKLRK